VNGSWDNYYPTASYLKEILTPSLTRTPGVSNSIESGTSATASPNLSPESGSDSGSGSTGGINPVVIVVPIVIAVLAIGIGIFLWNRFRRRKMNDGDAQSLIYTNDNFT
jgi:hypothetical protein